MDSADNTNSSTINDNDHKEMTENVVDMFNSLNNRFSKYVEQIKVLSDMNANLHQQIDQKLNKRTQITDNKSDENNDNNDSDSFEINFINILGKLTNELQELLKTRMQQERAEYDIIYYKEKIGLFSTSDQIELFETEFYKRSHELQLLKQKCYDQEKYLQYHKKQYDEHAKLLNEYSVQYANIVSARMETENVLDTLKEEICFEREYNGRRQKELKDQLATNQDLNMNFHQKELEKSIKLVRQDYENYNQAQLAELEKSYIYHLSLIQDKIENPSDETNILIEQNRSLEQKMQQLETKLNHIDEENRQKLKLLDDEYNQLHIVLHALGSEIGDLRGNINHHSTAIDTYKYLLSNIDSYFQRKPKAIPHARRINGFTVHFDNESLWIRI